MLNHYTQLSKYQKAAQGGQWQQSKSFCLLNFPIEELSGKTLGIIGYGELGKAVANIAKIFVSKRPGSKIAYEGDRELFR